MDFWYDWKWEWERMYWQAATTLQRRGDEMCEIYLKSSCDTNWKSFSYSHKTTTKTRECSFGSNQNWVQCDKYFTLKSPHSWCCDDDSYRGVIGSTWMYCGVRERKEEKNVEWRFSFSIYNAFNMGARESSVASHNIHNSSHLFTRW